MLKTLKQKITRSFDPYTLSYMKRYWDIVELNTHALLDRQFIPDPRNRIYIETSGVCNLQCRFCAYTKKELAKVVMPLEQFRAIVEQAVALGFSKIGLTPLTGEVFVDKTIIEKMQYLDAHPQIKSYHFYSNLVAPTAQKIEQLFKLKKLDFMHVSLYGHDRASFCALTRRPEKHYDRLVANLELLDRLYNNASPFQLRMNWRTTPDFSEGQNPSSELQTIVREIGRKNGIHADNMLLYNNWGGQITDADVNSVGLKVNDGSHIYKKGPCALLLYRVCILADGRVNACACRDVNGSLVIGDVTEQPLAEILSTANPLYMQLLEEQLADKFRDTCKTCDFYRSIHKRIGTAADDETETRYYHLNEVKQMLGTG
jgi:sulfatase maturation enzyme AslB (radical SAM superfamily)